jgi:hypothetical protein
MMSFLRDPYIAYACVTFCMQSLHNIFIMFYVSHFRASAYLTDRGFYIGQVIYLVWNSVNDPLFGHGNDRAASLSRRSSALARGALWLPLAFMTVWADPITLGADSPVGVGADG